MPKPSRENIRRLEDLPNVGKAMASDLRAMGIKEPFQIIGKNPLEMYDTLCKITGKRQDPCVMDVFMSIVHFMEKGESLSWWSFTNERKRILCDKKSTFFI